MPPSPVLTFVEAFGTSEAFVWQGIENLRNQHQHKPFNSRLRRRDHLLMKVSNRSLTNNTTSPGPPQLRFVIDDAPSVHSSSDASGTTRSSSSSPINGADSGSVTSLTNTQYIAEHLRPMPEAGKYSQGSGDSFSHQADGSELAGSPLEPHSTFLVDQEQGRTDVENIPRPMASAFSRNTHPNSSLKKCTVCFGAGWIDDNLWQRMMAQSQPSQQQFTGHHDSIVYFPEIPTFDGYDIPNTVNQLGGFGVGSTQVYPPDYPYYPG